MQKKAFNCRTDYWIVHSFCTRCISTFFKSSTWIFFSTASWTLGIAQRETARGRGGEKGYYTECQTSKYVCICSNAYCHYLIIYWQVFFSLGNDLYLLSRFRLRHQGSFIIIWLTFRNPYAAKGSLVSIELNWDGDVLLIIVLESALRKWINHIWYYFEDKAF